MAFPLAQPGSRTAPVGGLENKIEFNGIVLGDMSVADCYQITEMQGFSDAVSLRSNYEVNPQTHGEIALLNYLNGRTMVITGVIRAHNVDKLRDMIEDLKMATVTMVEKPLILRNQSNPTRDIQIYSRIVDLNITEKQDGINLFRNFQLTFKASDPRFKSVYDSILTIAFGVNDLNASGVFAGWDILSGSAGTVSAGAMTLPIGTIFYRRNDFNYTDANYTVNSNSYAYKLTLKFTTPATISSGDTIEIPLCVFDANNYITVRFVPQSATTALISVQKFVAGTPTTLGTNTATFTIAANTNYWLVADFLIGTITSKVFTTDPTAGGGTQLGTTHTYTLSGPEAALYQVAPCQPAGLRSISTHSYKVLQWYLEPRFRDGILITFNSSNGNFPIKPKFRFVNAFGAVSLTFLPALTDDPLTRFYTLPGGGPAAGDYYEFDGERGTTVNAAGASKISKVGTNSGNILMPPQAGAFLNMTISTSVNNGSANIPQLILTYQDVFI